MARKIEVWLYGRAAGLLQEDRDGFAFVYHPHYVGPAVSLSMPVTPAPYFSRELHPFFRGLAPEGWLRKRYSEIQKIDDRDLLGLLMHNGNDLLGAIVFREVTP